MDVWIAWLNALEIANFRAATSRRRYSIKWNAANRLWDITELVEHVKR